LQGQLQLQTYIENRCWEADGLTLLSAEAVLPRWEGQGGGRFNRYYQSYAKAFVRYCQRELLPRVTEEYHQAVQSSGALPSYRVELHTTVTLHTDTLLSLFTDSVETGGRRRLVLRRGDTWNLATGYPMEAKTFFPHGGCRKKLLTLAEAQICQEQQRGVSCYDTQYRQTLRTAFNSQNFYLTDRGLCFFYQMYAIAPAAEGIPTFCLPYNGETGPLPPALPETEATPAAEQSPAPPKAGR